MDGIYTLEEILIDQASKIGLSVAQSIKKEFSHILKLFDDGEYIGLVDTNGNEGKVMNCYGVAHAQVRKLVELTRRCNIITVGGPSLKLSLSAV